MNMHKWKNRSLAALLLTVPLACGEAGGGDPLGTGDDGTGGDGGTGTADDGGTETGDDDGTGTGTGDDDGPDDVGEIPECDPPEVECDPENEGEDCDTGYCHAYSTVPLDPNASCQEGPPFGELRLLGELRSWEDYEIVSGMDVKIAPALPTAQNPVDVTPLVTGVTDELGRFDLTTTNANEYGVGMVAILGGEGTPYYLTGTGMVEPKLGSTEYPPGVRNHNVWVMNEATLQAWSDILAEDPEMAPFMPLGDKGGVIGRIWDACAQPIGGVNIVSRLGEQTQSLVRYLNADEQSFNRQKTSKNGLFVIAYPLLPEKFDAFYDGVQVNENEGTVGNAPNAIFTVTISVDMPQG
jgi:hypothetical protein